MRHFNQISINFTNMKKLWLHIFLVLLSHLSVEAQNVTAEDYYVSAFNEMSDIIQTENLILRVMGIPYINDGSNHGPLPNGAFPECSLLPSFR